METVKLPKGTVVRVNGVPCELAEDTEVKSATIAGMGVDAYLRWPEGGHGEPHDEWPEWVED